MKKLIFLILLVRTGLAFAQPSSPYFDSLKAFRSRFVEANVAVKASERKYFQFFPIDSSYRIDAQFVRIENAPWFEMAMSDKSKQIWRKYGELIF
ncbi:MAG: hypothetical protein ACHQEM_10420, partial [Chitinophagales bacterium]